MELFKGKKMPSLFNNQYNNLASKGRYGDTMLAHINPQEAALLKSMGGAGTINPQTGLPEFFGLSSINWDKYTSQFPDPDAPPVLAQVFQPNEVKEVAGQLQKVTVPQQGFGLGTRSAYETIDPELNKYADKQYGGMGVVNVTGYTVPTDLKFQGKPLEAKYDPKGNFVNMQLAGGDVLIPDPNQPNIAASPKFNKSGGIVDYGVFDLSQQDSGGFGDFVSGLVSDFGPMILTALGANYLAGSGLLGAGAAAPAAGGTLAGMGTGAAGAAATAAATGIPLAALTAGGATEAGLLAGGGSSGGLAGFGTGAAGVNATAAATGLTPAALGVTGLTAAIPTPSVPTPLTGSGSPMAGVPTPPVVSPTVTPAVIPSAVSSAASSITPSMLDSIAKATGISVDTLKTFAPSVIQGLIGAGGSYLTSEQAKTAAQTQADAQIRAAQIAADAARFRPVGVTTRFGTSNFTTDAAGNIVTAGYTPSAEITGYQDRLKTLTGQGLTDVEAARTAYQPLTSAAQSLFTLGKEYFAKTPEQAAQDYITKQQALLAPSQENQLALLQNKLQQQGRGGLSVAQGGNLRATTPEMQAYYNSIAQSNLALAAQADQEARNRITYGAGLFDTGANLQGRYYTGQTAAYSPFTTAIDTSSGLERLAQQPLDLSTAIGQKVSTANANVGQLTGQGIINAAGTMAPANAYSLGGNLLSGAASSPVLSSAVNKAFGNTQPTQQQYTFNPQTGQYVPVSQSVWI
jgi:hypothetical protein